MRKKEMRAVFTFQNTTTAMAMEKLCKEKGLDGRIIPVPRCITTGCGLAWSASPESRETLANELNENHICYDQIYEIEL